MLLHLQRCTICHRAGQILCNACQRHLSIYTWSNDLEDVSSLSGLIVGRHYDRMIKHLVYRLKYGKWRAVGAFLWSKLANIIYTTDLITYLQTHKWRTIVTAVPTHWIKRHITRWYNQAQLLALSLAQDLDLPYQSLLYKSRWTASQVKVSRRKRLTNIIDSFTTNIVSASSPSLIILIDDIITTGATMSECARILHDQYPQAIIRWVCIARNR